MTAPIREQSFRVAPRPPAWAEEFAGDSTWKTRPAHLRYGYGLHPEMSAGVPGVESPQVGHSFRVHAEWFAPFGEACLVVQVDGGEPMRLPIGFALDLGAHLLHTARMTFDRNPATKGAPR
jgi:hypothetical protein